MHYALPAKRLYPIETEDQVKTASLYFDKHIKSFHPAERVAMAKSLEKRASELKMPLDHAWINNYARTGSEKYSPEFGLHMGMRKQACAGKTIYVNGKNIEASDLLEKVASQKENVKPTEMVELVSQFDKLAGLSNQYDQRVRDPFFTVYGSSANPKYDMVKISASLYEKDLQSAIYKDGFIEKLANVFGQDFADNFRQDPINIYNSMPKPERSSIIDMMQQTNEEE